MPALSRDDPPPYWSKRFIAVAFATPDGKADRGNRSMKHFTLEEHERECAIGAADVVSLNVDPHWYNGASHEWGSLILTICANVSLEVAPEFCTGR
jgi:hypothetical protein